MEALLANLPFLLLFLLCPLMMLFMHRGGGHDGQGVNRAQHHVDDRAGHAGNVGAQKEVTKT